MLQDLEPVIGGLLVEAIGEEREDGYSSKIGRSFVDLFAWARLEDVYTVHELLRTHQFDEAKQVVQGVDWETSYGLDPFPVSVYRFFRLGVHDPAYVSPFVKEDPS